MANNETITAYFDLADNNPIEASFSLEEQDPIIADFGINVTSSTVFWGSIFGNLEDQPDLVEALELLYPKSNPENYTSNTITFKIWYKDEEQPTNSYLVVSDDNGNIVLNIGSQYAVSDIDGNVVLSNANMLVTDDNNGNVFISSGE